MKRLEIRASNVSNGDLLLSRAFRLSIPRNDIRNHARHTARALQEYPHLVVTNSNKSDGVLLSASIQHDLVSAVEVFAADAPRMTLKTLSVDGVRGMQELLSGACNMIHIVNTQNPDERLFSYLPEVPFRRILLQRTVSALT